MDKAKKTRLSVIVLKTLLHEILKKGKINANEKQIFQKVLKSLKLPQENLVAIQRDAKIRAKQNPETENFEEKLFYRRLKDELKMN